MSGDTYTVEYTDHLASPNWQVLTTIVGDGAMKEVALSRSARRRFFRAGVQ